MILNNKMGFVFFFAALHRVNFEINEYRWAWQHLHYTHRFPFLGSLILPNKKEKRKKTVISSHTIGEWQTIRHERKKRQIERVQETI